MSTRIFIPLLLAGAIAFVVAPRSHTEASSTKTAALATIKKLKRVSQTTDAGAAKVTSNFGVKVEQQMVRLALTVTNSGAKDVEITFPSGQSYDFAVLDSTGTEVWRWATGRMFTQALRNKMLEKGETMTIDERWNAEGRKGRFTAVATLRSSNYPIEHKTDFVIP